MSDNHKQVIDFDIDRYLRNSKRLDLSQLARFEVVTAHLGHTFERS